MDILNKFKVLSSYSGLELVEDIDCQLNPNTRKNSISRAVLPNGKIIKLAKTLLTSACERNCYYCPFRAGRNYQRETLSPTQLANLVYSMHQSGKVEGIFISSGIAGGGQRTQDLIIETAELLRYSHGYQGYLHLKIMPGADYDQVLRMMQLANRVSINLEGPNQVTLSKLAPHKSFYSELIIPLQWIETIRNTLPNHMGWNSRWPSSSTQFVVGGADETDLELLDRSESLYTQYKLSRVYYSAFNPIKDTPLENHPPVNPTRQLRLYQANFMIRDYGFRYEELPFNKDGYLPIDHDPKTLWAQMNLMDTPVEINTANKQELVRIPGIGIKTAQRLLKARRIHKISSIEDLRKQGLQSNRFFPYILLDGKKLPRQLSLV